MQAKTTLCAPRRGYTYRVLPEMFIRIKSPPHDNPSGDP